MSDEVWKPIPGYEGLYEVSDMGQLRSLDSKMDLTREKAHQITRQVPWKTKECGAENCWCRLIVPVDYIDAGDDTPTCIVSMGAISKENAEYIVTLHNRSLEQCNR